MEIPIPVDPPFVEYEPPETIPETEPPLQEDLWRYRFPWVKTAVGASPYDDSLAIENGTSHVWMLWHRYHGLGALAPEETRAIRLDKAGLLSARQFPAPPEADHILLVLDPAIARIAIEDASGGEGFYAFTVIERSAEIGELPADERLPVTRKLEDSSLEDLGLSARTENLLKRHGITTGQQPAAMEVSALMSLEGLRPEHLQELMKKVLTELGILKRRGAS